MRHAEDISVPPAAGLWSDSDSVLKTHDTLQAQHDIILTDSLRSTDALRATDEQQ